jgi:hypothetical protein
VVSVLLLHTGGEQRVRPEAPGRDQTGAAHDLEGDRHVRARAGPSGPGLVSRGVTASYDHTLQTLKELPYGTWRTFSPKDTVRFYALRLHEAGPIKTSPQKIIAQGTDWRFLNELKKELKG